MTAQTPEVLIAGAGPTGLLLALWLTRLGVRVSVVDPKPGPTTETRAIAVQARTLEFYDQIRLGQDALTRGRHATGLCLWTAGQMRASVDLRGAGAGLSVHPDIFILTQDHNEALLLWHLTALGGSVEWQTALTGLTQDADGVTATLERDGQTEIMRADYLAGCDGAGSAVRTCLGVRLSGSTYPQRFYVADVPASGPLGGGRANVSLDDGSVSGLLSVAGEGPLARRGAGASGGG